MPGIFPSMRGEPAVRNTRLRRWLCRPANSAYNCKDETPRASFLRATVTYEMLNAGRRPVGILEYPFCQTRPRRALTCLEALDFRSDIRTLYVDE